MSSLPFVTELSSFGGFFKYLYGSFKGSNNSPDFLKLEYVGYVKTNVCLSINLTKIKSYVIKL